MKPKNIRNIHLSVFVIFNNKNNSLVLFAGHDSKGTTMGVTDLINSSNEKQ